MIEKIEKAQKKYLKLFEVKKNDRVIKNAIAVIMLSETPLTAKDIAKITGFKSESISRELINAVAVGIINKQDDYYTPTIQ